MEHVSYDIILELCELARNMCWPDGLVLNWLWHGHGFKLWWRKQILKALINNKTYH